MNPKVQPHNLEAEQSVLGAAFISKSALQKVCDDLMPMKSEEVWDCLRREVPTCDSQYKGGAGNANMDNRTTDGH